MLGKLICWCSCCFQAVCQHTEWTAAEYTVAMQRAEHDTMRNQQRSRNNHLHYGCDVFTFLSPPPGTWPMLSREPTLDWTLNSSFSFLISTFPPPEENKMYSYVFSSGCCCTHFISPCWLFINGVAIPLNFIFGICSFWISVNKRYFTWFMMKVWFGAAFRCHAAQIDLFVNDLDLCWHKTEGRKQGISPKNQTTSLGKGIHNKHKKTCENTKVVYDHNSECHVEQIIFCIFKKCTFAHVDWR